MQPIGYNIDCDTAECAECHDPAAWTGFEGWAEPAPIFSDTEADSPTHCARCGRLIPHQLTPDGIAYVRERLRKGDGPGFSPVLEQWRVAYAPQWHWHGESLTGEPR